MLFIICFTVRHPYRSNIYLYFGAATESRVKFGASKTGLSTPTPTPVVILPKGGGVQQEDCTLWLWHLCTMTYFNLYLTLIGPTGILSRLCQFKKNADYLLALWYRCILNLLKVDERLEPMSRGIHSAENHNGLSKSKFSIFDSDQATWYTWCMFSRFLKRATSSCLPHCF